MGNIWVRMSSNMQLWLINHSNCITDLLLHIIYGIDVLAYSLTGPLNFLSRRSELFGPNYAALGRIICGEYDKCTELIQSPQQRGYFLGRAKLIPSRVSEFFPLFLSDADAGGGEMHSILHNYIWEVLIPPALERASSDLAFIGYVKDMIAAFEAKGGIMKMETDALNSLTQEMTIKYVFHALFGVALSEELVTSATTLFFGGNPFSSYVLGAMRPFGTPFGCFLCKRSKLINDLVDVVRYSPAMINYYPSPENGNISKQEFCEMLIAVVGIAGFIGTQNLCRQVITAVPPEYPIDLDDRNALTLAVLEAARLKAPVNNVNTILQNPLTLDIDGKEHTFPKGTVVAASIGLASVDPKQFKDPMRFNPKRENLVKSSLNFNHVGFEEVGSGTRQCPGRNIAMKLATTTLIELRKSYNPPK